jgi:8-oxo-dGTP pyrophosphatase MutT (NUDIX family)
MPAAWPAIEEARRTAAADPARQRMAFHLATGDGGDAAVGSVARSALPALAHWPTALRVADDRVTLIVAPAERDAALAEINRALRDAGLLRGWRDETVPLWSADGRRCLATMERAAARFWGSLTLGAHANGHVVDASGAVSRLWIARRSATKATDPGRLDNLVGGGVPLGQTPDQALLREAAEEAGLAESELAGRVRGRVIAIAREVPEGFQREWIHVYDLALPAHRVPVNRDGEVAEFRCWPIQQALALAGGSEMTVDASLVTLDFALRRGLFEPSVHAGLAARAAPLFIAEGAAGSSSPRGLQSV